jgi:hypothetical protein
MTFLLLLLDVLASFDHGTGGHLSCGGWLALGIGTGAYLLCFFLPWEFCAQILVFFSINVGLFGGWSS